MFRVFHRRKLLTDELLGETLLELIDVEPGMPKVSMKLTFGKPLLNERFVAKTKVGFGRRLEDRDCLCRCATH